MRALIAALALAAVLGGEVVCPSAELCTLFVRPTLAIDIIDAGDSLHRVVWNPAEYQIRG